MKAKVLIIGVVILLTACNYPTSVEDQPGSSVWIDQPLDGSTLMIGHNVFKISISIPKDSPAGVDLFLNGVFIEALTTWNHYINQSDGYDYYAFYANWQAEAPGKYLLEARMDNVVAYANFSIEGPAEEGPDEVAPPRPTQSPTPTFTQTPKSTATREPEACTITALVNLFCRPGPGYEPVDSFVPDQSSEVLGITSDGFYYLVLGPNFGNRCTVPNDTSLVSISGDCDSLPGFELPPPPTATFTPTPRPTATFTPVPPQCSDGVDNDSDGLIDLNDRECRDANDDDEANR